MDLTDNQRLILESKYKLPEETDEQWLNRIVLAISKAEGSNSNFWKDKFKEKIESMDFLPGGSILTNAGVPVDIEGVGCHPNGGLNNCSALFVGDSIESIARTAYEYAVCAKHRIGVGVDLSPISYRGRPLRRTRGKETASGVISMMKLITSGSEEMSLGGCLHENTLIFTKDGLHSIKEIVTNKLDVKVLTPMGWKRITQYFYNGIKPMWDVITKRGHHIIATEDHKLCYLISDVEIKKKPLKDFSVGDTLIEMKPIDIPIIEKTYYSLQPTIIEKRPLSTLIEPSLPSDFPLEINEDFGYWLGIATFRGYLGRNKDSFTYIDQYTHTCINIMIREKEEQDIIEKIQRTSKNLFFTTGTLLDVKQFFIINIQYPLLITWMVQNGLKSLLSREGGYDPKILTQCPSSVQRSYIAGIFDTNGVIENEGYKIIASDCRVLESIQTILLRNGISSSIIDTKNFIYSTGWLFTLIIHDEDKFIFFILPYSVKTKGECEYKREEEKIELVEDEILSIEYAGEFDAYDLEIEDTHKYVANGLYVSNSRRSAGLIALRWDHPDIIHFVNCKRGNIISTIYNPITNELETSTNRPFHNVNLSVLLDEAFWIKLDSGDLQANKVWDEMTLCAWETGDPGIIYIDNVNRNNPLRPLWGDMTISNACSEILLYTNNDIAEVCDLGSIILPKHLKKYGNTYIMDFNKLRETITIGLRFLDNVLDISYYPLEKMKRGAMQLRRLGLGVTGFADILMLMGISYGSPECISLIHTLFSYIRYIADEVTQGLGIEKGNFPMLSEINKVNFFAENRRNIATLALAPTGSVTTLGGCFGYSIEPIFGHSFLKLMPNIKDTKGNRIGSKYFLNPYLPNLTAREYESVMRKGTLEEIQSIDAKTKSVFLTTREIPIETRLSVLSTIQQYIDNGISTTVNLPEGASVDDIKNVFRLAHDVNIKAITVYRDNSLQVQAIKYGVTKTESLPFCERGKG